MPYIIAKKLPRKTSSLRDPDKPRARRYVIEGTEVIFCVWVSRRKVGKKTYLFPESYETRLFKTRSDGTNFILHLAETAGVSLLSMKM